MASKAGGAKDPLLLRHTSAALQNLCTTCGLRRTGTKPILANRLRHAAQSFRPLPKDARVLSLDMGIRNFALSLITPASPSTSSSSSGVLKTPVRLLAWERIDLLSLASSSSSSSPSPSSSSSSPFSPPPNHPDTDADADDKKETEKNLFFTPSALSYSTLRLAVEHLLPHRPTHVLIERQRFRSGGAAAVLEWTVRVNSLEAMLHAVLAALNLNLRRGWDDMANSSSPSSSSSYPSLSGGDKGKEEVIVGKLPYCWWWHGEVQSIAPKVLAGFLLPEDVVEKELTSSEEVVEEEEEEVPEGVVMEDEVGGENQGRRKTKRKRAATGRNAVYRLLKQEKIKLLTEVLSSGMVQPAEGRPREMVDRFLAAVERKAAGVRRKKTGDKEVEDIGKMDDLCDSLLQGMAWVQWQSNLEALIQEQPELLEQPQHD
ncbi:hypothetical protein VTJ04DRAFT_8629 [Mycothermus thermophilus]|uniref:uncharacterized protein n=1 Tax=Humicola insolens TaxID=85995 RepID=UPI003742D503